MSKDSENNRSLRGWAKPINSRKTHYFDGIMAICDQWMYAGPRIEGMVHPDRKCKRCERILEKQEES